MLCIFNGHKFSVDAGTFFEIIVSSEMWSSYRRLSQLRESDQSRYMLIIIIILFISDNKIALLLIYKQLIIEGKDLNISLNVCFLQYF